MVKWVHRLILRATVAPLRLMAEVEQQAVLPDEEQYGDIRASDNREKEEEQRIMVFYCAQLFLRRRLNELHAELYGYQLTGSTNDIKRKINEYEESLAMWRKLLPDSIAWNDEDPKSLKPDL